MQLDQPFQHFQRKRWADQFFFVQFNLRFLGLVEACFGPLWCWSARTTVVNNPVVQPLTADRAMLVDTVSRSIWSAADWSRFKHKNTWILVVIACRRRYIPWRRERVKCSCSTNIRMKPVKRNSPAKMHQQAASFQGFELVLSQPWRHSTFLRWSVWNEANSHRIQPTLTATHPAASLHPNEPSSHVGSTAIAWEMQGVGSDVRNFWNQL